MGIEQRSYRGGRGVIRDNASQTQVDAADPHLNTWLSANAGSGKTRVLTDRVARLLLDGVNPQNILCLTYTKAAASEMQNRLFKRLGSWSMLSDAELRHDLEKLGVEDQKGTISLAQARRLFARAIETPGGLKIQTIHSFCASVLRRFPLEAQVSPQFVELDETSASRLQEECLDLIATGPQQDTMRRVLGHYGGSDLIGLANEIAKNADYFRKPFDELAIKGYLELSGTDDGSALLNQVFLADWEVTLRSLIDALATGSKTDISAKEKLEQVTSQNASFGLLSSLESVFLYGEKAKSPFAARVDRFPTKAVQQAHPDLMPKVHDFMERVADAREKRLGLLALEKATDLHSFGAEFIKTFEAKKLDRGVLDFDDLIKKTLHLLKDASVAQWVLFRLDGGIDHLLVDEAQDTSPIQWSVIHALTQEFSAGLSSKETVRRTVFVVGDKKQSIYSFQGADPKEFDRMSAHFERALTDANDRLEKPALQHSFRSSQAILRVVDQVFVGEMGQPIGGSAQHIAFNDDLPGRVDLWPLIEPAEAEELSEKWYDPVDSLRASHHDVRLAEQIANQISQTTRNEKLPCKDSQTGQIKQRPITEGDFLILVQRRSDLFNEIIRACKAKGLKVAGADRLQLNAELAVKDICALLSFLALPEDSLSLAAALKSPLFGWSEQELYKLAYHRTEDHLWQALRQSEDHPQTLSILDDLRSQSDFLRPYELIERLLTRHNGRSNLLRRLGMEAADGIDALLAQAIQYEAKAIPSLTGFLCWLESEMTEIKRQSDNQADEIRVMTVHGAKGLEAPIVILPDTADRKNLIRENIVEIGSHLYWKPAADQTPAALLDGLGAIKTAQEEERLRLLYVAMTRAENWLIVCGASKPENARGSWYRIAEEALEHAGCFETVANNLPIKRVEHEVWNDHPLADQPAPNERTKSLENLSSIPPVQVGETWSPSDLGGAKVLTGEPGSEEGGKARGRAIHFLLENLTDVETGARKDMANSLLEGHPDKESISRTDVAQVVALLEAEHLRWVFGPNSVEEVSLTAMLPTLSNTRIHGIIDRLIINEDTVTAVDYKSNSLVPKSVEDTPEGLLRQMGAYDEALRQIYPNKSIRTAILWTETGEVTELPHELVSNALARVNVP